MLLENVFFVQSWPPAGGCINNTRLYAEVSKSKRERRKLSKQFRQVFSLTSFVVRSSRDPVAKSGRDVNAMRQLCSQGSVSLCPAAFEQAGPVSGVHPHYAKTFIYIGLPLYNENNDLTAGCALMMLRQERMGHNCSSAKPQP